ncbi:MAG: glycine C-acetyltransferase [Nitrospira sp.]|nr:glycine C-acetyltransferase [Candidatus Manganitrophaceae bacterium]HIL34813.1 glycine C-acetyltransferase [Candidatus Manganitrophaceae bacterium]
MIEKVRKIVCAELAEIKRSGLTKEEWPITSPQGTHIIVEGRRLLNLCANNYLDLADHLDLIQAAKKALDERGYGMASVRFICGTQDLHTRLEARISTFLKTDATLLFSSCFDANTGLFETLFSQEDAILSDALNHASIIDGVRLCKAARYRYRHMDMDDLEEKLREAKHHRMRIITTDGVFSMDGEIAPLTEICRLAERYESLVMVDDSHATGFMGDEGRGSIDHCDVMGRVDLITSTLGKAMGGASGGFVSGRRELIDLLRQRSRPYLFSNALPPMIASAALAAFDLLEREPERRKGLRANTRFFREGIMAMGLRIKTGVHPIIPVLIGDPMKAKEMAKRLFEEEVFVVPFSFPVVPRGEDRIRVQISAAHDEADLAFALGKFKKVAREVGIIK